MSMTTESREGFPGFPPGFEALFGPPCPPTGAESSRAPPGLEGLGGLEAPASCTVSKFRTLEGTVQVGPPGFWRPDEEHEERLTRAVAHASHVLRRLGEGEHGGELTAEDRCELAGHSQNLDCATALDLEWFDALPTTAAFVLLRLDVIAGHGDMARRAVREAERAVGDVLILVCTRDMMSEALRLQGLPAILTERILTAFHGCVKDNIFSALGVAKYHLFNEGMKFSRRRARQKKAKHEDGKRVPW